MSGGTEFIDVTQYRGSIGQHYTASRTPMTRKRLSYLDVLCISLFAIHGLRVLPIAIFLFFVPHGGIYNPEVLTFRH
jgi:hypothetical protein